MATKIAGSMVFGKDNTTAGKGTNISREISETFPVINQENDTVYYIINYDPMGFMVLAADQRSIPVLAYSADNSFSTNEEHYPSGLVKWLESARNHIDDIRAEGLEQDPEIQDEWDNLVHGRIYNPFGPFDPGPTGPGGPGGNCPDVVRTEGPLMTTEWHQSCGFNDDMPILTCGPCGRALAGCVPIAIAQVMRYHEHPNTYNWSNMPDISATSTTFNFIRDVFDNIPSSEKSYSCGVTGVDRDYNVANFLKVDFNYSSATNADYNYQTDIIRQQIDWGRPVILSGAKDTGWWFFHSYDDGHMWVCDGYKRVILYLSGCIPYYYLHLNMNWGWGGSNNGWFFFDDFTPASHYYNDGVQMVFNIAP